MRVDVKHKALINNLCQTFSPMWSGPGHDIKVPRNISIILPKTGGVSQIIPFGSESLFSLWKSGQKKYCNIAILRYDLKPELF